MKKTLLLMLILFSFIFANEANTTANVNGTWELSNSKIDSKIEKGSMFTLIALEHICHFMVVKNSKIEIPFISKKYQKPPYNIVLGGKGAEVNFKLYLKPITKKKLQATVTGDYNYTLIYNKTTPIEATKDIKFDSLYINYNLTKFLIFNKDGSYKTLQIYSRIDYSLADKLSINKDIFKNRDKHLSYGKSSGRFLIKNNKLYATDILSLNIYKIDSDKIENIKTHELFYLKDKLDTKTLNSIQDKDRLFYYAVFNYKPKLLKLLLKHSYKIKDKDKKNILIEIGEDLHYNLDANGEYSRRIENSWDVYRTNIANIKKVIEILVKEGADINAILRTVETETFTRVDTPLSLLLRASKGVNSEAIDLLLNLGSKVKDIDVITALANHLNKKSLKLMLKSYKFNQNDDYDVLFTSIKDYGDFEIFKTIYNKGFYNTTIKDCCEKMNAIEFAITYKRYDMLKYMLSKAICRHSIKNIKKILISLKKDKTKNKKFIKILDNFIKKRKKVCTKKEYFTFRTAEEIKRDYFLLECIDKLDKLALPNTYPTKRKNYFSFAIKAYNLAQKKYGLTTERSIYTFILAWHIKGNSLFKEKEFSSIMNNKKISPLRKEKYLKNLISNVIDKEEKK